MKPKDKDNQEFPGYPHYSQNEDIYQAAKEESELDPEDPKKIKPAVIEEPEVPEDLNVEEGLDGSDLDVPGAELDDEQEELGSEDEENNYYSLGGDNNQEEDQGS